MKEITTSNFSFESMRSGNALYVDKTQYVWKLVGGAEKMFFLSRPRRFGKSLLLSTLEAFFLNKRELFRGLAIDTLAPDGVWQEWPVIHLDMAKVSSPEGFEGQKRAMDSYLRRVAEDMGMSVRDEWEAAAILDALIIYLRKATGKQVVVLVDEYDKPILDALHTTYTDNTVRMMQGVFQMLKSNIKDERFVFITGVSKFAHTSLFSGANNPTDITQRTDFAAMLGYTEQELRDNFSEHIDLTAQAMKMDREALVSKMEEWYDGFRFTADAAHVFNPVSVGKFFQEKAFRNYWFATGTPTFLVRLMKTNPFQLTEFAEDYVDPIDISSFEADSIDPVGLAVQTGYLTIKDVCRDEIGISYRYGFPNEEIRVSWNRDMVKFVTSGRVQADRISRKFLVPMSKGDVDSMMKLMQSVFAGVTKDHLGNVNEGYYRNMMYMLFTAFAIDTHAEEQVAGGIVDIVAKAYGQAYVFELKVSRTGSEAEVEKLLAKGIDQVLTRRYADKYRFDASRVHVVSVVFDHGSHQLVAWKERTSNYPN